MKYSCSILIYKPLKEVVSLWEDERFFKEWQDGYVRTTSISGRPNTVGAKSKIIYDKLELTETILVQNLPFEKTGLYEHIHMTNTQTSRFEAIDEQTTKYISEVEYTAFHSLFSKIIAFLFPFLFKNQSKKWMRQFKTLAENKN